ncbi:MAG: acyltransferase, partial [Erysipelotrichaceae bacterium]|nr:acyltransferase [Erysipelotrichaceae bacterium]
MRKHYLDNIRWLTVVLVVFYHVLYMYNAEGIAGGLGKITDLKVQYYDLYLNFIYPWLMPILFIVSGITSRLYLESHSDREFIRSRTTKLLVPSTIGLFVFQFIQGYINMSLSNALDQMAEAPWFIRYLIMAISGQGVLWFAQMLWLFSVMLIGVRKLEKDRGWQLGKKVNLPILLLLTGAVWLSAQSGNTPVIVVYRFGLYNTLYFLGYFIFSHQEVMEVVKKNFWLFLALALSLGVVFCFYSFGKNYADEPVYRSVLFTSYSWLGCLAILGGFGRYFDFETGFTRWMSRHSFGLYVFHYLGISAVALFMAKPELLAPLSVYLLSTLAGFAVGYLLPMIIARLPFISWAV